MAITKERKNELVDKYVEWLGKSDGLIITQYTGLSMKQIDDLRGKVREAGGEFHVVKNTLGRVAFEKAGLPQAGEQLEGSTAVVFAFRSTPEMAKVVTDYAAKSDFVKVKGGYLDGRAINAKDVQALAELPPLPVMRAQLLGVLNAPASKLVRTLAEPGRGLAAVIKAFADRDSAPAEAAA